MAIGLAMANGKAKEQVAATPTAAWTAGEAEIVAAVQAGDVERVALEFSAYGVERRQGETVTAAILRRVQELGREEEAAAFQRRVQAMALIKGPQAFRAWLLGEVGRMEGG